jgi:small-conductance mechanosensitive channel
MWRVVTGTALPTLAALALAQGLRWSGLTGAAAEPLLSAAVFAIGMGAFVGALAAALLMRSQGSWRLLSIGDEVAKALMPWGSLLAVLTGVDILVSAADTALHVSPSLSTATDAALAAIRILAIGGVLVTLGRLRTAARAADPDSESGATRAVAQRAGVGVVTLIAWLVTLASAGALLLGYTSFSLFLTRIAIEWLAVVVATFYLLMTTVDDVVTTVFSADSRTGHVMAQGVGIRASAIDQFGVLLSGVLRLGLAMVGVVMLLTPFGSDVGSTFDRFGTVADGVTIGDVSISPGAVIRGLVVLLVGLALARLFLRWLNERYLPTTEMDLSARNSFAMIARYIAIILAVLWGLASLGIGMERIALLLSALSVGIGFGLQAITQNFVSGLILLAERPVKIGDLVRIGNDEGDVKRISVRSTEIELADHSTLIVPNSELITKPVLNKTLANALGRVQVQFSVPLGVDPGRIRQIVLDAFAAEPAILAEPEAKAFVDSIVDGRILFNCFAHTSGPRAAYPARSAVLLAILQRLADEHIDVGSVPQQLQLLAAEAPPAFPAQ